MTSRPRRIVFLGTHGQYNVGDELLLETFLTALGPEHRYVVNSYDPAFTRRQLAGRFDVTVIDTARDRHRLLRALRSCDVVYFGGGSIVKELYASTGRHRYATLLMILAIVTFTRWVARRPVAMLHVGVGPLPSGGGLRLARLVLAQVDVLTVRDLRSRATCDRVGVPAVVVPAVVVPDAVFSVDRAALLGDGAAPEPPGDATGPLRVALNLNVDVENPAAWEQFLTALAGALVHLDARHGVEVHTLPMQTGFKEHDDAQVLAAFAARLPGVRVVHHAVATPADAARLVAACDVVVAERLHAIVLTAVLGVAPFVLAYDVKVRELARTLHVEPWPVDVNDPPGVDVVAARLLDLAERRAQVARAVADRGTALHREAVAALADARAWVARAG